MLFSLQLFLWITRLTWNENFSIGGIKSLGMSPFKPLHGSYGYKGRKSISLFSLIKLTLPSDDVPSPSYKVRQRDEKGQLFTEKGLKQDQRVLGQEN